MRAVRAFAVVLLVATGYGAADAQDLVPGPLTTRRAISEPAPYPTLAVAPAVAPTIAAAPAPRPALDLQPLVDDLSAVGPLSVTLLDAATGEVVGAVEQATPRPPASSLKLLTAAAALEELGPDHVLVTTATWDGTTLTLVGGGDLLLGVGDREGAGASLTDLAHRVAERLGQRSVALAVDDTLFSGSRWAADWSAIDRAYVMPMSSLAVGAGRSDGTTWDAEPAQVAAEVFARELAAVGVTVGTISQAATPPDATEVGRVESAPLSAVVRHMLKVSDNSVAEALGRLVSLARGGPGSAEDAPRAVMAVLDELGITTDDMVLRDTSGLASTTRVTTDDLVAVLAVSADPEHPRLRQLMASLPVAALDGTLADRLGEAAGRVRAKTGTLMTVVSLSGVARTDAGGAVIFAVILPELPTGEVELARERLDEFVTALTAALP